MEELNWEERIAAERKLKTGKLILSHCGLTTIPAKLLQMTWLTHLDLAVNQIVEIENLDALTNLSNLNLSNNNISKIQNLDNLVNLDTLYIGFNKLSKIENLDCLINLGSLGLYDNQINKIENLQNLKHLIYLSLGNNQLNKIENLDGLEWLSTLEIDGNQIRKIENIQTLKNLSRLRLYNNEITKIENLESLFNLDELNLYRNKIEKTENLEKNSNLSFLDLSENKLGKLENLSFLQNLEILQVAHNEIADIDELRKLPLLKKVVLIDNKIKSLKPLEHLISSGLKVLLEDDFYQNEKGVFVKDNPLDDPPAELIQAGNEEILNYFLRNKTEKTEKLYEAKLLILGESGAGKTTLVNKLTGGATAPMPDEKDTTRGIEVRSKWFKGNTGNDFTINIWDFGGQAIYHATHQFFLTESSLYILLTDNRREDTDFYYWLQVIDLLSKQSPVIIVQNKRGGRIKDINKNALISKYPNIKEVIELDLLYDEDGLNKLNNAIEYHIQRLDLVGKDFFIPWKKIRREIEVIAKIKNYISGEKYYEIAESFNEDFTNASQLSGYLHNLGVFLHYRDVPGLSETIFLNSNWVTKGVYEILDSEVVTINKGHFTANDLVGAFSDNSFLQKKTQLIELMKQFQLCYELTDKPGNYITPHLLPSNEPFYHWDDNDNLQLQYVYDFKPKGIIAKLIVLLHYLINDTMNELWRSGVIFHRNNTMAKVIETLDGRDIKIHVHGEHKRDMLVTITDAIDLINNKFHDLKVFKKVPCICSECKLSANPYFFEYPKLLNRQAKGVTEIECENSFEKVSVDLLLENIDSKLSKKQARDHQGNDRGSLKTFISYSKFDGESNKERVNYLEEFKEALSPLIKYNKLIEAWDDTKLIPGENWNNRIITELQSSDIIFLLVSSSFLNTNYIINTELKIAFEREERGECIVVPVIIRDCGWTDVSWLSALNAVPRKGGTIVSWKNNWSSRDQAWTHVYGEIKGIIEQFKNGNK